MYFRVFKKFRVCTCIHDTRYTIHDIDEFCVYTVTSLIPIAIGEYKATHRHSHTFSAVRNFWPSATMLAL